MKLEPNMYVRTEKNIFKIKKINDEFITVMNTQFVLHHSKFTGHYYFCDDDEVYTIGKTSHIYNIKIIGCYKVVLVLGFKPCYYISCY